MLTPSFPHPYRGAVLRNSSPDPVALGLGGFHPLRQAVPGHFDFSYEEAAGSYNTTFPKGFPSGFSLDCSHFARRYFWESRLISLPPPTWMLPFGGFPLPYGSSPGIIRGGKSHSGISGSKTACVYPELIAACHALRQRPSRAIRQAAYHAEPFRNPHSIRVNSEASSAQLLIADPAECKVSLSLSSLPRLPWELHVDRPVASHLPSSHPCIF